MNFCPIFLLVVFAPQWVVNANIQFHIQHNYLWSFFEHLLSQNCFNDTVAIVQCLPSILTMLSFYRRKKKLFFVWLMCSYAKLCTYSSFQLWNPHGKNSDLFAMLSTQKSTKICLYIPNTSKKQTLETLFPWYWPSQILKWCRTTIS